ncbi:MAG: C25 family cysteine peptidase [Candidatus Limimorpha sp.]
MNYRYKLLFAAMLLLLFPLTHQAQTRHFKFEDSAASEGFTTTSNSRSGFEAHYAVKQMQLVTVTDNGYTGEHIRYGKGIFLPANAGQPDIPSESRFVAIPNGATVNATLKNCKKQIIQNVDLMAAAPIPSDTDDRPATHEKDRSIYGNDAFFPAHPVNISEVLNFRGVQVVALTITPYQYNPVTKELIVYYDMDIALDYEGGDGGYGEDRLRSPFFDPILQNALCNYDQLPVVDYEARVRERSNRDTGCEYLIVIPNNEGFRAPAQMLADFRNRQGIMTEVKSLSEMGCTNTNELKTYFHNAYNNWNTPPVSVLLFGDHNTNMATGIPAEIISHPTEGTCITDNQYSDCTGDYLPDICFCRLVAANPTEAQMMVNKTLDYEYNHPNMNAGTYQNPITALGWQTERWFQICSEVVGGYWRNQGKTPVRINAIYLGSPGNIWSSNQNTYMVTNYFGPGGRGYIPATPAELGGWTGGTAQQVVTAVNNGAFILQHRDHGYNQGWGEPAFSVSNVSQMNNTDKLTFVMTINCQTGNFNYGGNCLVEAFMRRTYNNKGAGAVGCVGPTQTSFSFVNDAFVWGMYDLFDPNFMPDYGPYAGNSGNWMPAFGNIAGKYFLAQSSWPYNSGSKYITYQMFTAHCDAFLRLYTKVPQTMNVTHTNEILPTDTHIQVTAPAGSTIALTVGSNIIAVATATGSSQNISFAQQEPGANIRIVVTKQDYLRYEDDIEVLSTAVLNVTQHTVNDQNHDGVLEYGESATFDFSIKNVGGLASTAGTATLTTLSSQHVTITNGTANVQALNPSQSITLSNAFGIQVSNSVPDNLKLSFNLHISCGGLSWDYPFLVTVRAPMFTIDNSVTIVDNGNENGRLDPGETAQITLSYTNSGGSPSGNTSATLSSTSSHLNISNPTINAASVGIGQTLQVSYNVSVSEATPSGESIVMTLNIASGAYTSNRSFSHRAGLDLEGFESGNLLSYEWENDASHPWAVVTTNPYEGSYCLQSGGITNSMTSSLSLTVVVENDNDEIRFFKKTSSQANKDKLVFYIDNVEKGNWSGNTNWSEFSANVTSGEHTFTWAYEKDNAISSGSDCAWIDNILLPVRHIEFSCHAGSDIDICKNDIAQLQGNASGYETLNWTTAGDGTFDNSHSLTANYTPGAQDIANGHVMLTLSITDAGNNSLTDDVVVRLHENVGIEMNATAEICFNDTYNTTATVSEGGTITWTSNGDGSFANPNMLLTEYTPGAQDIANGSVVLTLSAASPYGCEGASATLALTIHALQQTEIDVQSCGTYMWNGQEYSSTGDYEQTLSNAFGCDSIVTLHLTLVDSYAINVDEQACDSYVWNGTTYTLSGVYTGNFTSVNGCDSIVTLNLTVYPTFAIDLTQVACDSYVWNGTSYTQSGVYTGNFTSMNGCDSIVTLNLTIESVTDMPAIEGESEVDVFYSPTNSFSIPKYIGETNYEWTLIPAKAGTLVSDQNSVTINWSTTFIGDVTLKLVIHNDCGERETTLGIKVKNSTSVSEHHLDVSLFPNPADDMITINIANPIDKIRIEIYNLLGERMLSQNAEGNGENLKIRMGIADLPPGSYLMNLMSDKANCVRSFIVK